MKKLLSAAVVAAVSLTLIVSCGGTGMSPEAAKFIDEYEAFVEDFCALSNKARNASLMQKITLAQQMVEKSTELKKYADRQAHIKAGLTPAGEKKLEAIAEKAARCSENFKM